MLPSANRTKSFSLMNWEDKESPCWESPRISAFLLPAARSTVPDKPSRELHPRLKAFFMAYSEAIATGRKNREVTYQVFRKYMRIDNLKLLDFTYRVQFLEAIPAKPYPREDAIQASIEDLKSTIPKLDGMKVSDFMDASLIRDIDNEGFFTRLEKQ